MNGKRFLITGASKGLGEAITEALLKKGAFVCGLSRSLPLKMNEWEQTYPNQFQHHAVDLTEIHSLNKFLQQTFSYEDRWGGLINNAALAYDDLISNLQIDPLEIQFKVNVYAPMLLSRYFIRNCLYHKTHGSIVHISSICTQTPFKGLAMYAASKGALEEFSLNLNKEWNKSNITSHIIAPGFMDTSMTNKLTDSQKEKIHSRGQVSDVDKIASEVLKLLG